MNPAPPPASPSEDPLGSLGALGAVAAQWMALAQPWLQGAAPGVKGQTGLGGVGGLAGLNGSTAAGGPDARLAGLLAQAQWLATGSLGRVVQRGTTSWGEYLRAAAAGGGAGSGMTVDAARLHLRRLRECALDEAHLLDTQFQALDEQLRALLDGGEAAAEPRPHARPKR
jgi:hypothetical protein